MQCPIDGTTLQMTERQGIEIDYCPQCRGVWLDRGELDKMIEYGGTPARPAEVPPQSIRHRPRDDYQRPQHHYDDDYHHGYHKKHHKKENFLGDLFDF